ncbi:SlyX family protein [Catenovulum sediminis]|uniref:Protein SlyX homolog n=1 Tax=Catenovulum sediminis TaxID=1740262 RepID=A0ABV1RBR5_9ALTE|nr:SlyX family protein [Catenovulum sediminis]
MTQKLENKIDNLEAQLAFQEDTIATLNDALVSQQQQISLLEKQVALLARKVKEAQPDSLIPQSMETPPPHY